MNPPKPEQIKILRKTLGIKQKEAADLVHVTIRAWQWWESGERAIPLAVWELFLIKVGFHPIYKEIQKNNNKIQFD